MAIFGIAAPWETPEGEGFIAPWTEKKKTVDASGKTLYAPVEKEKTTTSTANLSDASYDELRDLLNFPPAPSPEYTPNVEKTSRLNKFSGGLKWPGSTPEGVGFIAPWTEQAAYEDEWGEPSYIQLGGAEEQVEAGRKAAAEAYKPPTQPSTSSAPTIDDLWNPGMTEDGNELAREKFEEDKRQWQLEWDREKTRYDAAVAKGDKDAAAASERRLAEIDRLIEQQKDDRDLRYAELDATETFRKRQYDLDNQQQFWEQEQAGKLTPYQEQYLGYLNNQLGQEQKNYEAQLRANPVNWLQYEDVTGGTPVIQPWMKPLMPQQYGMGQAGSTNIPAAQATPAQTSRIGQPIPGWGNAEQMPKLIAPATQYRARMGPTAYGQHQGYQQYTTGASPEQTNFKLWNQAPPSGKNTGLTYMR